MDLIDELGQITTAFNEAEIEFALCGGLAMAAHGLIRATEDIDVIVRSEDLSSARTAVASCGFTILGGEIPLRVGTTDEGLIFRVSKVIGAELLPLDIMLVTPAYETIWQTRTFASIGEYEIPVVSREGMIKMKMLSGRTKDQTDLDFLRSKDD
ncbi:MAG: nucleotidyl transferase AbiEii/AbiGii toxin family protein [Fuerstiella sp.]